MLKDLGTSLRQLKGLPEPPGHAAAGLEQLLEEEDEEPDSGKAQPLDDGRPAQLWESDDDWMYDW